MAAVELYSASVCPFAHRTRLTLIYKGIDFSLTEIDLNHKPEGFKSISPYEKVPVIKHGEARVWESSIINEYLEDVFPEPPLMPTDPDQKAMARIWIDFANTKFINAFYKILLHQEVEKQQRWQQELVQYLQFMEEEGFAKHDSSYWLGDTISLVDITFYPWFERWSVLEHYRGLSLPAECKKLKKWWQQLSEQEFVKSLRNSNEFYIQEYEKYANGTASGITAKEMKED